MKVFHFRPYTLHLGRYELSRGTMMLPLPRIAMEILILLVERRGDLLTRGEIAARVWPGSDPEDVFQSINTAVNRIRSTLRDEAGSPKYVQTVIGRGYRFIAAVEETDLVDEGRSPRSISQTDLVNVAEGHTGTVSAAHHLAALSSAPLAMASVAVAAPTAGPEPKASVIAVAEEAETFALPTRITRHWRLACFLLLALSVGAAFAVWYRFADVSKEHRGAFKLTRITDNGGDNPVTAGAVSPDGKSLAYADLHGITLREPGGGVRALRTPGLVNVNRIEWFPDGRHLVVSGTGATTHTPQIWSVATSEDAPRPIRDNAALGVPSPDGSRIAYTSTSDTGATSFWVSDAAGGNEVRVDIAEQGKAFRALLWSADARKLILEEEDPPSPTANVGSRKSSQGGAATHSLMVIDIQNHTGTAAVEGIEFTAACLWGKSGILFAGSVGSLPYTALWKVDLDPETGAPLAAPVQLQLVNDVVALSRSADSRELAAVFTKKQPDVYVATLAQPGPTLKDVQRITFDPTQDYPQTWTPDSKSILYESYESGVGATFHIYRQAVERRQPKEPLVNSTMVQVLPQQSPDGKWILFAGKSRWSSGEPYALYRVPEVGGTPVKIDTGGPLDEYRCPMHGKVCVLRETEGHTAFHYYALDPVAGKGRLLCSTPWTESLLWNWNVSPDGTQIALPVPDGAKPRIRVVPCAGNVPDSGTREVVVKMTQALLGVTWAADFQGWFVSAAAAPKGTDLFYVRADGSATFLRHDGPLWGVPSPDGQKLAFTGGTLDSNVWLLR